MPAKRHTLPVASRWKTVLANWSNVCMVATGTDLAPFISMIKQLRQAAVHGRRDERRYTLLYGSRTYKELAYHQDFV